MELRTNSFAPLRKSLAHGQPKSCFLEHRIDRQSVEKTSAGCTRDKCSREPSKSTPASEDCSTDSYNTGGSRRESRVSSDWRCKLIVAWLIYTLMCHSARFVVELGGHSSSPSRDPFKGRDAAVQEEEICRMEVPASIEDADPTSTKETCVFMSILRPHSLFIITIFKQFGRGSVIFSC